MHLKPDFNCCSSFELLSIDKVTHGRLSFLYGIAKVVALFGSVLDDVT